VVGAPPFSTSNNYESQFPYTPTFVGSDGRMETHSLPRRGRLAGPFHAELYHLKDDPYELRNQVNDPASPRGGRRSNANWRGSRAGRTGRDAVYKGLSMCCPSTEDSSSVLARRLRP